MKDAIKPKAQIDDLIKIEGYGDRIWRVDGYTIEREYQREYILDDVLYDCHCVTNAEYMTAFHEDVTLVSKAADAGNYLTSYEPPGDLDGDGGGTALVSGFDVGKLTTRISAEPSTYAKRLHTDKLLDELGDLMTLKQAVGDEDGKYSARIAEICAAITRLNGGD